ncbi:ATP-binding protein [Rathayibacter sp. AY1C5]|uniref:BbrUII/HgiDII family restriction enzyme n=1 Tax=Rathayibacter sp. AY1C5 TaxID=2080538 RepID=UPI000CE78437|nr:ATP-binding protein [Rathayibacter sp. AY1C5]PPG61078.1 hypothetical protein C5C57_03125 [Rathayibacter sp. AY1C5]
MPLDKTYKMSVELSVLESLGINLYSNAAAVLSELVANAYDADAGNVSITWKPRSVGDGEEKLMEVVVTDDGSGMDVAELNARFLKAGYKKRGNEGLASPKWSRPFMGRKGIGKLAVFSLARVVEVYSKTSDGDAHGFRIDVNDLEECIKSEKDYHPQPVDVPHEFNTQGTTLVLSDLKSKRAGLTSAALRKRLARRFDVLDETPLDQGGFHIVVNGSRITWADRQELKKLEFIWEFGPDKLPDTALPKDVVRFELPSNLVRADKGWKVSGWFGTTKTPTDLVGDTEAGSLKNIIVIARKRPIQEGIIEKLDFSRLFGNYVTGQIQADFLDLDDPEYDDIATSDRQRLIEDDERVTALQEFLRKAFVTAAEQWSKARPKREAKDALSRYPKLAGWVDELPKWQQDSARKMVGTIAGLDFEGSSAAVDRSALFRSGVLAFARVGLRESADELDQLSNISAVELLPLLGQQDAYEAGLWVDILRSRVQAIEKLQGLADANEKEKVLQQHLFDHLWLLDPSWERATGSETMEEDLRKIQPGLFAKDELDEEITGRIDIRYKTVGGKHVIVELKRYDVKVDARKLAEQGTKYAQALSSILSQQQLQDQIPNIEVIFVLGQRPGIQGFVPGLGTYEEYIGSQFRSFRGSYRLYDSLIASSRVQYQEYLDASHQARKLEDLLSDLAPEKTPESTDVPMPVTPAPIGTTDQPSPVRPRMPTPALLASRAKPKPLS